MPGRKRRKQPSTNKRSQRSKARDGKANDDFLDRLKGKFQIVGDITSPVYPPEAWTDDLDNLDCDRKRQS